MNGLIIDSNNVKLSRIDKLNMLDDYFEKFSFNLSPIPEETFQDQDDFIFFNETAKSKEKEKSEVDDKLSDSDFERMVFTTDSPYQIPCDSNYFLTNYFQKYSFQQKCAAQSSISSLKRRLSVHSLIVTDIHDRIRPPCSTYYSELSSSLSTSSKLTISSLTNNSIANNFLDLPLSVNNNTNHCNGISCIHHYRSLLFCSSSFRNVNLLIHNIIRRQKANPLLNQIKSHLKCVSDEGNAENKLYSSHFLPSFSLTSASTLPSYSAAYVNQILSSVQTLPQSQPSSSKCQYRSSDHRK